MKTSINSWALDPSLSLRDRIISARKAGFDAIEVNFEEDYPNPILTWKTADSELREILRIARGENLIISSICSELHWKYSLGSGDESERWKAVELAKVMIYHAAALEAPSVLVIPGIVHAPAALRRNRQAEASCDVWRRSCESMLILAEAAENTGITVGVENVNFNGFLLSPIEMKNFIESANHPLIKAHLDIGNANINGVPQDWILTLAEQIYAVHLKDSVRYGNGLDAFRVFGRGDIEWSEVSRTLEAVNFSGFLIVEQSFNSLEDVTLSDLADRTRQLITQERKEKT